MITTISPKEKLKHIYSMLSEISNIYERLLLLKNVTESVFVVMNSILELGEGCLQKDIALTSYVNKKTVNSTIKKLQKDNYIELKAGKYPNMHIYLTEKGHAFIKENILPVIEVQSRVLANMTEDEFEGIKNRYKKYIDNFREQVDEFAIRKM